MAKADLSGLPYFTYGVILADPPWHFDTYSDKGQEKSVTKHYDTMTTEEIAEMRVGHLAAGDCFLVMWTTWPILARGDAHQVMSRWGFRCVSGGAWAKRTAANSKRSFGKGYGFRDACEPFLVGVMGSPRIEAHNQRNFIDAKAFECSRKPEEMSRRLERMFPNVERLELFARRRRRGWTVWGNEVDRFSGGEAAPRHAPASDDEPVPQIALFDTEAA